MTHAIPALISLRKMPWGFHTMEKWGELSDCLATVSGPLESEIWEHRYFETGGMGRSPKPEGSEHLEETNRIIQRLWPKKQAKNIVFRKSLITVLFPKTSWVSLMCCKSRLLSKIGSVQRNQSTVVCCPLKTYNLLFSEIATCYAKLDFKVQSQISSKPTPADFIGATVGGTKLVTKIRCQEPTANSQQQKSLASNLLSQ